MPVKALTRRMSRPALTLAIALAGVLIVGLAAILIGLSWSGRDGSGRDGGGPTTVTGPVDGARNATFELLDGATSVRVRAGSLGDDLYRVTVPDGGGFVPHADRDDDVVRLHLKPGPEQGSGIVDVVLNAGVGWTVRLDGGTRDASVDLSGGLADGVQLAGGSSRLDIALPKPGKPVAVEMTGGVDQFRVRLAAGTPTRVQVGSGAGQVVLDGQTHQGIGAGQNFTANGWQDGAAGVDVQARAGVGALMVGTQ
ncbi:hypothetical protein [Paractinoplanes durhamensis]|uniref:Adhesin domain-containing protein n=1 Tax=Paractinoplanes durhamensis TaxID=113563 RepID=A0ABQ3Z438_9ACTN|nr:hypothetical protein [Actinoplanes durhamensis]GIE04598.1 hypothetical protein Adu01nite_59480 [Actinoplanes durhamensis]